MTFAFSALLHEEKPNSDVDLLVSIAPDRSLFDLIDFKHELENLLSRSIDIGTELHPVVYASVTEELISL
ncbi:nucleotidyltransferase family protein [Aneurinibacillus danicus]|jgi:hypothetical protein|uniref:Polymerase nucleotidyl transferase domain-containing protein n=1 Tax=Aneurinibacillus danicus TaxID=267746 RepID=A0A511VE33_9BACL|nr:nucleotidyltransferase domain-containing protein [Aneurinibacillus danicus]GEN36691.1 hypothetical protein ADA01nite_41510 [Aneurinibacillus danicus]